MKGNSMTHEDAGRYAAKHAGAKLDPTIAATLKKKIAQGNISCAAAHTVASELQVAPGKIGISIDLLEAHLMQCQLGLFGWGDRQSADGQPAEAEAGLHQAIKAALVKGRLPCAAAWKIADTFSLPKNRIKAACDSLDIKINSCQLGTFS